MLILDPPLCSHYGMQLNQVILYVLHPKGMYCVCLPLMDTILHVMINLKFFFFFVCGLELAFNAVVNLGAIIIDIYVL